MVELRLQQSLIAERSANPNKSWTLVVCLAEVAAITNQHDCAAFEWALLEECDLTEYQLWAQRGSESHSRHNCCWVLYSRCNVCIQPNVLA